MAVVSHTPLRAPLSIVSNFAFFQTNTFGQLWGTDSWADPNLLFGPFNWNPKADSPRYCSWASPQGKSCGYHFFEKSVLHLARQAGAEVWPSIGGWTLSDPFPAMAANEDSRTKFADNCVELIEDYGFDGIDIDWEYPPTRTTVVLRGTRSPTTCS